jgi:hypothetical protein
MTVTDTALISLVKWGLPLKARAEQPTVRERREAERAIAYWESKVDAHGQDATVAVLDLAAINSTDWSNRFVIAVDDRIERSMLLLYGSNFAGLLDLPSKARLDLPLNQQLPKGFSEVFLHGCAEAQMQMAPVRLEGEIERYDQGVEQYRAVFISVAVRRNSLTHLAFGAFSSRTQPGAMDRYEPQHDLQ